MKKLLASLLLLCTFASTAKVIDVTAPFNYQTMGKDVRINFRVNATTLSTMPSKVVLYINNTEVKEIPYYASKYFLVNNMKDGQYVFQIALLGMDKRMLHVTDEIMFYVRTKPLELAPMGN